MEEQGELFICDIVDVAIKGDVASLEHPIFSVSHKPDMAIREYTHGDTHVRVIPSGLGAATIHDRDILLYAISQLTEGLNRGEEPNRAVSFAVGDFLRWAGRPTGGTGYARFRAALERLQGTFVSTSIVTGDEENIDGKQWGMIEEVTLHTSPLKQGSRDGKITRVEILLSRWLYRAVTANQVLTLDPEYFQIKQPLSRRIYELARKHCGNQNSVRLKVATLHNKSGSQTPLYAFRRQLKAVISRGLPGYDLELLHGDLVEIRNKTPRVSAEVLAEVFIPPLAGETIETARDTLAAFGVREDVYTVEQEWRRWMVTVKQEAPKNPDMAFIGFCTKYHQTTKG